MPGELGVSDRALQLDGCEPTMGYRPLMDVSAGMEMDGGECSGIKQQYIQHCVITFTHFGSFEDGLSSILVDAPTASKAHVAP